MKNLDLHLLETPWELEEENKIDIDSKYKTDNNNEPIFNGGDGIPSKKLTDLSNKWANMESLCHSGLVKVISKN